uniref:AlNc14C114G6487 protein n=1 Tax=Albugo laibachii Nc14 TaxID=890382 RepID=F0WIV2_9STRA|nr:AlNc14C114G6487 [Albugo laibachii Nc14]|eukprot:CCA21196.1 AlNc14C114G6487 [Albugo laibachii Nc14]
MNTNENALAIRRIPSRLLGSLLQKNNAGIAHQLTVLKAETSSYSYITKRRKKARRGQYSCGVLDLLESAKYLKARNKSKCFESETCLHELHVFLGYIGGEDDDQLVSIDHGNCLSLLQSRQCTHLFGTDTIM